MNGYLLDTNVLSELTKPAPAPKVEAFFVTVLSIGEIRKGIASLPASNRRALLENWLDNEIMPWLENRVLPVTLAIAERWGGLSAQLKAKGKIRPIVDAILGATAFQHDLVLVTRNVRDYADLGISILKSLGNSLSAATYCDARA